MFRVAVLLEMIAVAALLHQSVEAQVPPEAESYYHFSLAKLYDSEGQYVRALQEFRKALDVDPDSAQLHLEYARTLSNSGRTRDAIAEAAKAVELDPQLAPAHFFLGSIYHWQLQQGQRGRLSPATDSFERVVELQPQNVRALYYLGQLYFFQSRYREAAATLAHLLELRPEITRAALYRARALAAMDELHGAIEVLELSLKQVSEDSENIDFLARLYEETDQIAQAIGLLQEAIEARPSPERRFRLALLHGRDGDFSSAVSLLREVCQDDPGNMVYKVELAKALEGGNRFREAAEILRQVTQAQPDNREAHYYLASSQRALGRRQEAIKTVQHLLNLVSDQDPSSAAAYRTFLALLYQEQGNYTKALEIFRQLAQERPENRQVQLGLIYALKDAGHVSKGLERSAQMVNSYPDDLDAHIARSTMLAAADRLEEGVQLLVERIRVDSEETDYYLAVAQLYSEKKMYARAQEFVEAGLEEFPESTRLQFQLAALYERQDNVAAAEAQFQKLLRADPSNAGVLNYLGYMLADRGLRLQEALSYVEKAVELEPDNGAFLDSLGWTYFKLNQLKSAEFNLVQAAEINKSDPTILEHLGDLYLRLQDYSRARTYYQRSIKFAEDPAERTKVEEKLSSLERLLSDPPD